MVRIPLAAARPFAALALLALAACIGTVLTGSLASLYYTESGPALRTFGLLFERLRPLHETLATAWMFLGGSAIVYHYLFSSTGPPDAAMRRRMIAHLILWAAAGAGILVSVLSGHISGREYLGYSPVYSALILAGWILFAWNYFGRVGLSLRGQPAYRYMWSVAIPLFVFTYVEGHLYLFDAVSSRPLRDIAIQWKSNGVLVGSFNQILYGSLLYVSGRLRGDDRYAHSNTAFALAGVGLLNTFSNYGHHTYHLPQSPWIHWTAFLVSMLEVVILAKLLRDLGGLRRPSSVADDLRVADRFARSTLAWTTLMLALAIAISVPPLNALIHGTHVVVAHSMGSMIGIDSMILWCAFAFVLQAWWGDRIHGLGTGAYRAAAVVNASLFVFWCAFLLLGLATGGQRYLGASAPDFSLLVQVLPSVLVGAGFFLLVSILWIVVPWIVSLVRVARVEEAEATVAQVETVPAYVER